MAALRDLPRRWRVGTTMAVVVLICLSIVAVTRVRSGGADGETVATGDTATSVPVSAPEPSVALVPDAAVVEAPPASEAPTIPSTTTTTAPKQTKKETSNDRTAPFTGMGAWVDVFE